MAKKGIGHLALRLQDCEAKFKHARRLEDRGHTELHQALYEIYLIQKDIIANSKLLTELNAILKQKSVQRSKNQALSIVRLSYSPVLPAKGTSERKKIMNRISEYAKRINDALAADINMDVSNFFKFQRSWRKNLEKKAPKQGSNQSAQSEWIRGTGTWIGFPNARIYRAFCEALRDPEFHHVDLRICVLKGRAVIMRVHAPEPRAELHPFPVARYLRQKI